ncbi:MAG: YidC/Oxa1 family membrane protein insertase [Ruminococcaceae bacterium]|nr:YidC/Oxa1 family membrane protein insertase [Oscillospiraceae bacterium]
MFLSIWDVIQVPFGYLLEYLYRFTSSYGWALIIFAFIIRFVLLPTTAKSKKSTMKMSRLTPQVQFLQKKYANDREKQAMALQQLYKEEGVSMGAGCLWSLVPLLIMFPLYTVVREPIEYLLHESGDVIEGIISAVGVNAKDAFAQIKTAAAINENPEAYRTALEALKVNADTLQGLDFTFLGINLGADPDLSDLFTGKFWTNWSNGVGPLLIVLGSAGSSLLSMLVNKLMNNSVVTNEKGIRDPEAAKNSQANSTGKTMMYMMPLMSLWIGFSMPSAMSLYWLAGGVATIIIDVILTKRYRKIYDEEDASKLRKALMEEEAELERERIRAERRAANPDGITQNTSKKKLQQNKQREEEAAKAAAKREYNAKKGIFEEEAPKGDAPMSGISDRPFAKGRAYNAQRYSGEKTEE